MPAAFSLETVLRLREHKEEREERALLALGTQRQQLLSTLERVKQELWQWSVDRGHEAGQVALGAVQQARYARLRLLQEAHGQLLAQLQDLNARRRQQQAVYLSARSAREMLTELKGQQRTERQLLESRREQRQLDDIVSAKRTRT